MRLRRGGYIIREFCMKNTFKLFWTFALVTVIGLSLSTCHSNNGKGNDAGKNEVNHSIGIEIWSKFQRRR